MFLLAAVFWSQLLVGVSASFSMVVEHGVEECFIIRAPKEKSIIRLVEFPLLFVMLNARDGTQVHGYVHVCIVPVAAVATTAASRYGALDPCHTYTPPSCLCI